MQITFCSMAGLLGLLLPVYLPHFIPVQPQLVVLSSLLLLVKLRPFQLLAVFWAGVLITTLNMTAVVNAQLPESLVGQDLIVRMTILNLQHGQREKGKKGTTVRLLARIESLAIDQDNDDIRSIHDTFVARQVKLSWRKHDRQRTPAVGDHVNAIVRMKPPRGFVNPGGFDYQAWLFHQDIAATGYVKTLDQAFTGKNDQQTQASDLVVQSVRGMRTGLERQVRSANLGANRGLIRALLLGDRSEISQDQWAVLQGTGTIHLMAISGLHVGLIAGLVFSALRFCFGLWPGMGSAVLLRLVPVGGSLFVSGLYVVISGVGVPAQRAWWVALCVGVCYVLGRKLNPFKALLFVVGIVLMMNPFAATQQGFWLSFFAVFILLLALSFRAGSQPIWQKALMTQFVLMIGMSGVLFVFGIPFSASGYLANIIAVPVVGLLVVPLLFVGVLVSCVSGDLAGGLFGAAAFVIDKLWLVLELLYRSEWLFWFSPEGELPAFCLISGAILMVIPFRLKLWLPGAVLIAVGLLADRSAVDYRLTVLDVGQGLSVVFESPSNTLVYDTGARYSDSFNMGSRIVAPYLRYRNVKQLDYVVVSHGDNDHIGGLRGLVDAIPTDTIITNHISHEDYTGAYVSGCARGHTLRLDQARVQILWPKDHSISSPARREPFSSSPRSSNDQSCVVLIHFAGQKVLLTGDIERDVERELLESGVLPTEVDVLIAPHHGSATSSSMAFLKAVEPKHVVFSAGYQNRYRHPAKRIRKRYEIMKARQWFTGEQGAIIFEWLQSEHLHVSSERISNKKAWYK